MKPLLKSLPIMLVAGISLSAFAQTATQEAQRDINQQRRIEAGLQSGALTTGEAARLEREQARIDRAEAAALRDGNLNDRERQRIANMQNRASQDISKASTNGTTGDPNSASSRRMQADVARDVKQEQRIENGLKSGALTDRQAAKLEQGQARVDGSEAQAGRDGFVGGREQTRIQRVENHQSLRIERPEHLHRR